MRGPPARSRNPMESKAFRPRMVTFRAMSATSETPYARWRAARVAELGAEGAERRLRTRTEDGWPLEALYAPGGPTGPDRTGTLTALLPDAARRQAHGWVVRQALSLDEAPETARAQAADDLANGVASLRLTARDPAAARRLGDALAGLPVHTVELALHGALASPAGAAAARALGAARLSLGQAAWGPAAASGERVVRVSAADWFDRGAPLAASLGLALAETARLLRAAMTEAGATADAVCASLEVELAAGTRLLESLAAVRAARLLWARLGELAGAVAVPQFVLRQSIRQLTAYDAHGNLLRATAAAWAGALGGADVIELHPHDLRLGASPQGRRLARNVQHILRDEGHLHRLLDPAGGSFALEAMTAAAATHAWGVAQAVESGRTTADAVVAEAREARARAVATRRHPVVGVTEFPDGAEVLETWADASDAGIEHDAAPFEALRARADALLAVTGMRPAVHLARLGTLADATPRLVFAQNLVAAGGFAVAPAGGAVPAVLCGSDDAYAAEAATAVAALKAGGAPWVVLAGRPGELEAAWRAAGIDDFAYLGADVLAVLDRLQRAAGVPA